MDIKSEDVKEIKDIGRLHDDGVKIICTKGGFWIAVGKKEKNSKDPQALAAGNHPAIVMHELSQQFDSFQPAVQKSEVNKMPQVIEKTEFLPKKMVENGYKAYFLKSEVEDNIRISKYGRDVATVNFQNGKLKSSEIQESTPELVKSITEVIKSLK